MRLQNQRYNCVGCLLPSGNRPQFRMMRHHLKRLGIMCWEPKPGWFLFAPEDVGKLPCYRRKPFIPVDLPATHGHGIYEISARMLFGILAFRNE